MQQTTFASVAWQNKGKITRRERFLTEMDAVIPWSRLLAVIEPHYSKAGNGTQPKPMEQMLRRPRLRTPRGNAIRKCARPRRVKTGTLA
jgi:hypothetical protein